MIPNPDAPWLEHNGEPSWETVAKDWTWTKEKVTNRSWIINGSGTCPRCGHPLTSSVSIAVLAFSNMFTPSIECGCGFPHPGNPPGTTGCGYYARPTIKIP